MHYTRRGFRYIDLYETFLGKMTLAYFKDIETPVSAIEENSDPKQNPMQFSVCILLSVLIVLLYVLQSKLTYFVLFSFTV